MTIRSDPDTQVSFCVISARCNAGGASHRNPAGVPDLTNPVLDTLFPEPCYLVRTQPGGASGDMTETDGDGDTTPAGSGGDYSGGTLNMFARTSAHSGAASGGGLSGGGGGRSTRQQQHNKEAQKRYRCAGTVMRKGCPGFSALWPCAGVLQPL